jgi:hypothetical protein
MRLRIQTLPPLPDLKAWFIPDPHKTPDSIREFKRTLCSSVVVLKEEDVASDDIQLLLDDFELLDESPFAAALRDGDLIFEKALRVSNIRSGVKTESRGQHSVPCILNTIGLM